MQLWLEGRPAEENTATARYLRKRGYTGPIPNTIRHVDDLVYRQGGFAKSYPGLVAAVESPERDFKGLQRIYLDEHGSKAEIILEGKLLDVKKALGSITGGAARLSEPGPIAMVTEGIETGFSVLVARPDLFVLAAISANGMAKLELPEVVREVKICADNDRSGAGVAAAEKLAARLIEQGVKVRIALPPAPDAGKKSRDFNDVLLQDCV